MPRNPLLPDSRDSLLTFIQAHLAPFNNHQPRLKLSDEQLAALTAAASGLSAANARQATQAAEAKAATAAANAAASVARAAMASAVRTVRAAAVSDADPAAVYELALLPAPATPSPRPRPEAPTSLSTTLLADGAVSVGWKGSIAGTAFSVRRRLTSVDGVEGPWVAMESHGTRPFVDDSVPAGTRSVAYAVRGTRGGKLSPWSESSNLLFVAQKPRSGEGLRMAA